MPAKVQINISESLYLRDPLDTVLGKKIVSQAVDLIEKNGFESFTFKKLALEINSTEASVYRYFKNKLQLLNYLTAWYWTWIEYQISVKLSNISNKKERLRRIAEILIESDHDDPLTPDINEANLHKIIISESARVYFTDSENNSDNLLGLESYHSLIALIAKEFRSINKSYRYSAALAVTTISTAHKLLFDIDVIRSQCENTKTKKDVEKYLLNLLLSSLNIK